MSNKKVFIFLPDGVGLRNFAYTDFFKQGSALGYDIVYWNNTPFPISQLGYPEIRMENAKMHPLTYIYKAARKEIELTLNKRKTGDNVYDTYRFPLPYNSFKQSLKNIAIEFLIATHSSESGLKKIIGKIDSVERKTETYKRNLEVLKREKPAMVFLTNQRQVIAIST
ncbi:MAG: UDP-glycosyltransferase, partial [Flavobacterium sp.]